MPGVSRSDYYHSLIGTIEYLLMGIIEEAFRQNLRNWPMSYYGGYNAICLYMWHPSYSPFVPMSEYIKELCETGWRQDEADATTKRFEEERQQREALSNH